MLPCLQCLKIKLPKTVPAALKAHGDILCTRCKDGQNVVLSHNDDPNQRPALLRYFCGCCTGEMRRHTPCPAAGNPACEKGRFVDPLGGVPGKVCKACHKEGYRPAGASRCSTKACPNAPEKDRAYCDDCMVRRYLNWRAGSK